jgi:hypothetical protein
MENRVKKSEIIAYLMPVRKARGIRSSFVQMMKLSDEVLWLLLDLYTAPQEAK